MWQYLLHRVLGIAPEHAGYGKLGGGVVAHTTWAVMALCGTVGGIAWALSHEPFLAIAAMALICTVVIVFLFGTWKFADKHPDQAALGGAYWYKFREMQIGQKGQLSLPDAPQTSDPDRPPPTMPKKFPLIEQIDDE